MPLRPSLLRPSHWFTALAELVSDVEDWLTEDASWRAIRDRRRLPPNTDGAKQ